MLRFATFTSRRAAHTSGHKPSGSISAQRFPVEVWEAIIAACPATGTQLFPLLIVNSAFFRAVERVLYGHIDLHGDTLEHATRRIQLFYRLANDSHVAQMVELFSLPSLISDPDDLLASHIVGIYITALRRALRAMTRLRSLTLSKLSTDSGPEDPMGNNINDFFEGCTFHLKSLNIPHVLDGQISLVENQQSNLEQLTVNPKLDSIISVRAFPKLKVLAVISPGMNTKPRLLSRHRDISALYWMSAKPSFQGGPFLSVRSLRISFTEVDLVSLVAAFPSIFYLRLDIRSLPNMVHF